MPTYDYACRECGHRFEAFQSMKDDALTTCPICAQESLQRLIGAGAGLVFKGSGYYLTDYKRSSSAPSGGAPSASADASSGGTSTAAAAPAETTSPPPAKTPAKS